MKCKKRKIVYNNVMSLKDYIKERKKKKFKKKYKVGLCLSGGGARGFSFLGAFKAFEDAGIEFDAVAGTSAGSIFGAVYASKLSYEEVYAKTSKVKTKDFRNAKLGFLPSNMDGLKQLIESTLPVKKVEELSIPFYAVAVDLKTGDEIVFDKGTLSSIITGSCAIPGVYTPVKYKGMTLVDGGIRNNIPADVLRARGCDFVVTIDCNCTRGGGTNSDKFITQFTTSIGIMMVNNSRLGLELSDIVICPDMRKFSSLKIVNKDEMIKEGYRATMECIFEIEKLFLGEYKKINYKN